MECASILIGFAMGLFATLIGVRLQRSWHEYDDKSFRQKAIESLIVEIQNGLGRTKGLIDRRGRQEVSFGHIYVALWDSVRHRLAGSLPDGEVLNLLHHIYCRFDLINFNFDKNRLGASGAFAEEYVSEIESNLELLKERIGWKVESK